jgi:ubiquinone/menaquinone biosynthesis C-methylase UbiE
MDFLAYNRQAWNHLADIGDKWSIPVTEKELKAAQSGTFEIYLTPAKPVPAEWLGNINGKAVLCLASGGGQQVPMLAAAGAHVTSFDYSDRQLQLDTDTCRAHGLDVTAVQGDMRDLSILNDLQFDLIFHPCSNCFVNDVKAVWSECFRVLKSGGTLLAGFSNPFMYLFDPEKKENENILQVKYALPYSDFESLTEEEQKRYTQKNEPMIFSHTLTDQLGGQMRAGFHMIDLYEDNWGGSEREDVFFPSFLATRSLKPAKI